MDATRLGGGAKLKTMEAAKTQPEFAIILDEFKQELSKMEDHAHAILEKTYRIKDHRETKNERPDEIQQPGQGIIDELNFCLRKMSDLNNILEQAKIGLIKFVG